MRLHTINVGCKVNRVETDQAAALLLSRGFAETPLDQASVVLVNTCTVTGEADKKTRKAVRHALRENQAAEVIVTGCAAALMPEVYACMDPRVQVVPKAELLAFLQDRYQAPAHAQPAVRFQEGFRTRVGVKVQDGCNNACTYCIVHVARGPARSVPVEAVEREVVQLAGAGAKEIVLTGINLGTYSSEHDGCTWDLAALLQQLLRRTAEVPSGPSPRFRISSIEPCDIDDRLVDVMVAADGRVCRHLHLPLQSGSSKVLHEMARPYTAEDYANLVERLRAALPQLALSTDIIAGFPGETEADFAETLQLARACRFMKIHAFPYSQRTGTPAAERADQVPAAVKQHRAGQLRMLSEELRVADLSLRAGTTELALVEPGGVATAESYHVVEVSDDFAAGALIPVTMGL
ncbi:MAG: MiaB/RimO family radical SAM methylthiotransferase [Coriobacteriia bacterium]|nr:MiaB/RimO family radical SAM methylthiotransferase [Coriobacteriia bacterium]